MSDKNPCPFCGNESEYLRFLDLCAVRANEIWRENEVKIIADVYKSMDFVQIVRCRDCKHYNTKLTDEYDGTSWCCIHAGYAFPDDYCSWGERRQP